MTVDRQRLLSALEHSRRELLAQRELCGQWVGRLASSALSTATAVSALAVVERRQKADHTGRLCDEAFEQRLSQPILRGLDYLAETQNPDGGWGDTDLSLSNIATTMLATAAFRLTGVPARRSDVLERAQAYIEAQGGLAGLRRRYGKDKTFAVPILTNYALAGLISWNHVPALPFELAALPQAWYRFLRLPVVSYAVPALVAIGQARFFHLPPKNPLIRAVRRRAVARSLEVMEQMQPASGGFLEATPLTSFVVMSLASIEQSEHPVVRRGVEFLLQSAREDGSWPIDTNLATWNTTLALNALADKSGGTSSVARSAAKEQRPADHRTGATVEFRRSPMTNGHAANGHAANGHAASAQAVNGHAASGHAGNGHSRNGFISNGHTRNGRGDDRTPPVWAKDSEPAADDRSVEDRAERDVAGGVARDAGEMLSPRLLEWLLSCQHREPHPYTGAAPGGWAWTDLSGGVPDVDDTSGALLALARWPASPEDAPRIAEAAQAGCRWLLELQNRDGGWPTFCRGWGTMPFDRSATDLTAHAMRALLAWRDRLTVAEADWDARVEQGLSRGWRYLERTQRPDGAWLPLWFGNQFQPEDENPFFGTARVLMAFHEFGRTESAAAQRAVAWLVDHQNRDGGWGGGPPLAEHFRACCDPSGAAGGVGPTGACGAHGFERFDLPAPAGGATPRSAKGAKKPCVRSSVEETALVIEALVAAVNQPGDRQSTADARLRAAVERGLLWLVEAVETNRASECSPIGFYFAKLWYYEKLYPLTFTVSALGSAVGRTSLLPEPEPVPALPSQT